MLSSSLGKGAMSWRITVGKRRRTEQHPRNVTGEAFFTEETWAADSGENAGKPNRWHTLYETNEWDVRHLIPHLKTLLYNHTQDQIGTLRGDI